MILERTPAIIEHGQTTETFGVIPDENRTFHDVSYRGDDLFRSRDKESETADEESDGMLVAFPDLGRESGGDSGAAELVEPHGRTVGVDEFVGSENAALEHAGGVF